MDDRLAASEPSHDVDTTPSAGRYRASQRLFERALRLIPGGRHLSGRPLLGPEDAPMYIERGQGARCWDLDGHEYLDYFMAFGPFLLGYAHEEVDRAAFQQARQGNLLSLNHPLHVRFIERLVSRFPGAEMGVFFKTGSEATTAALRIARRATGRRKVARCGYHGWHDWCIPLDPAVPEGLSGQVLEFRASEPESLRALLRAHPGEVAAVIVAPEMVTPFAPEVFPALAEAAREAGAVFVLDEVKTAFRTPPGSIQQRVGVVPDLTTLSKALGNGWPVAAVVGTREVLRHGDELHLSATYHGETTGMAAALATLDILDRCDVAGHVWRLGERLIAGINAAAARHRLPAIAYGEPLPPMPFLRFEHPDPRANATLRDTFYREAIARGVLLHPRHLWFVSYAHRDEDIDHTLAVIDRAMAWTRERHAALL